MSFQNGALLAAVADGAGSARHAALGADLAVGTALRAVQHALENGRSDLVTVLREGAQAAREAILASAEQEGCEPREFASTLLMVIATSHDGAALQIGDGAIIMRGTDEEWNLVFWPQHGEYINTTRFITDHDVCSTMQTVSFGDSAQDIALMSDGLESLAIHFVTKTPHAPFLNPLFAALHAAQCEAEIEALSDGLEAFLSSERVLERTDDDVSLVIATRRARMPDGACG